MKNEKEYFEKRYYPAEKPEKEGKYTTSTGDIEWSGKHWKTQNYDPEWFYEPVPEAGGGRDKPKNVSSNN